MTLGEHKLFVLDEINALPKKQAIYLTGLIFEELRKDPKAGGIAAQAFLSAARFAALEAPRSRLVQSKVNGRRVQKKGKIQ